MWFRLSQEVRGKGGRLHDEASHSLLPINPDRLKVQGKPVEVEIPKTKEVCFPKLCPRCLGPTGPTVQIRHIRYVGFGILKVAVPICKKCWWEIMPKHFLVSFVLGWGFVALGVFLAARIQGGWGAASFFLCLIASRIAKDYNPSGVSFTETKESYVWSFPNAAYAAIFAHLNGGKIL